MLAGCGFMGEPLPPQAHIPARVADLTAVQRGSRIMLQFTAPALTTEGAAVRKGMTFDLRVGPAAEPFRDSEWASHATAVEPKLTANHAEASVDATAWTGKEVVLGVRSIGANGKDAGWSNFVIVPVVPAPEQPRNLRAETRGDGLRLNWTAAGGLFRVFRKAGDAFAVLGTSERPEFVDKEIELGKPVTYLVVNIVKLGDREAESELSQEFTVTPEDKFPPAVPTGLTAVTSPLSVELAWEQNTEADLAGYRIYRAAPGGDFAKVGESNGPTSYSDRALERGKAYRYAVTAVDKSGNESARSAVVEATVQE
jgi:hypothetical protein